MDSSFSVKHECQTKKHLGLYSAEFPVSTLASHGSLVTWNPCSPCLILVSKVPMGQCHGTWTSAQGSSSSLAPLPFLQSMKPPVKLPKWMPTMSGNYNLWLQLTPPQNCTGSSLIPLKKGWCEDFLYPGFWGPLCLGTYWLLRPLQLSWCCKYNMFGAL